MDLIFTIFGYIIPFLVVLTIVVFVDEYGHFGVARLFGTKIDSFSIGFGPEIFGWHDKRGTRWKVSWIPLGGYVKFAGDDNAASVPSREKLKAMEESGTDLSDQFHFKPLYQRALIVAAGPFANFALAIVIFAALLMTIGERQLSPRVDAVAEGSAAEAAGFEPGDVVLAVNGRRIASFADMQEIVVFSAGRELDFTVRRGTETLELSATPELTEVTDQFGNTHRVGRLGISTQPGEGDVRHVRYDPFTATWKGTERTYSIIAQTLGYVGGIFRGTQSTDQLGGPIRIAEISGQVASVSIFALISLVAILSVSIGLINLFPIPMLDGGHLMYYAYEAVAGKPLGERAQEFGFRIGLVLVLALMIFATWNDISRLWR